MADVSNMELTKEIIVLLNKTKSSMSKVTVAKIIHRDMSQTEVNDLMAMIKWMKKQKQSSLTIMANVAHDLRGFEQRHGSIGFLPRSYEYAKKTGS